MIICCRSKYKEDNDMTIQNKPEGTALTMAIEGRIDTQTAPDLQDAIQNSIEGVTDLILDFTDVGYISSAGLRVVLLAQNWMDAKGGTMLIRGAGKNIVNIFKITGFDNFLTLE